MKQASRGFLGLLFLALLVAGCHQLRAAESLAIYVDPAKGSDQAPGTQAEPVQTLQAALDLLPADIREEGTIHLAAGAYDEPSGAGGTLELRRPMRESAMVRIVADAEPVMLDWAAPGKAMITATEGHWSLENVQVGSRKKDQREGIRVIGPALLELHTVRIHTASSRGPGLHATRGGTIHLYGAIELNEDLHEDAGSGDSFCRVEADYFGVVRFAGEGGSLSIGNGTLCAAYYGVIELGCEWARITSWHEQANVIAVNDSGRVDFHSTKAMLAARNPRNTPIGLEHDGHVLAEGAPITIQGYDNGHAIVLQKASSFFCNDVTLLGAIRTPLSCMSGSTMLVGIVGDLNGGNVTTGGRIIIEKCTGHLIRPIEATGQGVVILGDGITSGPPTVAQPKPAPIPAPRPAATRPVAPANRPSLIEAATQGRADSVKTLLAEGAEPNQRDSIGRTALHWAAFGGHQQTCEYLLAAGADPGIRDNEGHTALDFAASQGHSGLKQFLSEQMQNR